MTGAGRCRVLEKCALCGQRTSPTPALMTTFGSSLEALQKRSVADIHSVHVHDLLSHFHDGPRHWSGWGPQSSMPPESPPRLPPVTSVIATGSSSPQRSSATAPTMEHNCPLLTSIFIATIKRAAAQLPCLGNLSVHIHGECPSLLCQRDLQTDMIDWEEHENTTVFPLSKTRVAEARGLLSSVTWNTFLSPWLAILAHFAATYFDAHHSPGSSQIWPPRSRSWPSIYPLTSVFSSSQRVRFTCLARVPRCLQRLLHRTNSRICPSYWWGSVP